MKNPNIPEDYWITLNPEPNKENKKIFLTNCTWIPIGDQWATAHENWLMFWDGESAEVILCSYEPNEKQS